MISDPKTMAKRLRADLQDRGLEVSHSHALELIARAHGLADWNTMAAQLAAVTRRAEDRIVGRLTTHDLKSARIWLEALGFAGEANNETNGDVCVSSIRLIGQGTEVLIDYVPHAMTRAHFAMDVADIEVVHRRAEALPRWIAHAGPVVHVERGHRTHAQFTLSTPQGHDLAVIRSSRVVASASTNATEGSVVTAQATVSQVSYPAAQGGPAMFAMLELFRKLTGCRLARVDDIDQHRTHAARSTDLGVKNVTRRGWTSDGRHPTPFAELIWEGDGTRALDCLVIHRDGSPPSRFCVDTTIIGDGVELITINHGGWVNANLHMRDDYTDWQDLLNAYAVACYDESDAGGAPCA